MDLGLRWPSLRLLWSYGCRARATAALRFSSSRVETRVLGGHTQSFVFPTPHKSFSSPPLQDLPEIVLEQPEGMEPFAGTVLSTAARRDFPDSLPPAGGARGSVAVVTQPGLSLSSSCQGPESWGESKPG